MSRQRPSAVGTGSHADAAPPRVSAIQRCTSEQPPTRVNLGRTPQLDATFNVVLQATRLTPARLDHLAHDRAALLELSVQSQGTSPPCHRAEGPSPLDRSPSILTNF